MVTSPSEIMSSSIGIDALDVLGVVYHLDDQGRSSDRRKSRDVWRWLLAPKPSMALMTVAPARPSARQPLDYGLIEGSAVPSVRLADKDAQQRPLAGQSHRADPTVVPNHTANKPAATEAITLATARAMAPPRSSCRVSYSNVENVV